jgi:hypothetical protein
MRIKENKTTRKVHETTEHVEHNRKKERQATKKMDPTSKKRKRRNPG